MGSTILLFERSKALCSVLDKLQNNLKTVYPKLTHVNLFPTSDLNVANHCLNLKLAPSIPRNGGGGGGLVHILIKISKQFTHAGKVLGKAQDSDSYFVLFYVIT